MAIDPSTGHEFAELPETSPDTVAEMVEDARRAIAVEPEWRDARERARTLFALARLIEANAEALADLETRDTGKPRAQALAEIKQAARAYEVTRFPEGRATPAGYSLREPYGVCAVITAWDAPLTVAVPALVAGNAVIVKPSPLASITALRLAELAERAGVPRGMIQVATGGDATGAALAEHADHVTFAGAADTAAKVAAGCGLTPIRLELTGPPLVVIAADADLDEAVKATPLGSRVVAQHPEAAERLAARLAALKVGAPAIENPDVGPVISERHLERALQAGGEHLGGLFVRPALAAAPERPLIAMVDDAPRVSEAIVFTKGRVPDIDATHISLNRRRPRPLDAEPYTRLKHVTLR
jgi:aldehyde dehydrogenase (NAD+)/betaine-aldehyde dehydrogenase